MGHRVGDMATANLATRLGPVLREARLRAGLSLGDVYERTDIRKCQTSKWELGRATPTLERLELFARAVGVLPSTLLRRADA